MSDELSFAEIEAQHVELLPARTVLSLFAAGTYGTPGIPGTSHSTTPHNFFPTGFCMIPGVTCNASSGVGMGGLPGG